LIPAQGVSTSFVTGLVDTNGQTATFTGIASFSTVVGLLSSGQKPGDLNGDGVVVVLTYRSYGQHSASALARGASILLLISAATES
jgi:hypothetical protein